MHHGADCAEVYLHDGASGIDPVKSWETLDHLTESVKHTASDAVVEAIRQTQQLADEGQLLSDGLFTQSISELADLLQRAAAENEELIQNLPESLARRAA